MMRQYLAIKAQHPDAIVFYRMGDFYEMFLQDAERAAPLLEIALTSRDKGKADPVPMCGVPVHAADQHVKRLAELGHRVAICEQVEDPRKTGGRRLVRREVIEVVTPGLVGDPEGIAAHHEVALAAVHVTDGAVGLAVLEASTGDFRATCLEEASATAPAVLEELRRLAPREVLAAAGDAPILSEALAEVLPETAVTPLPAVAALLDAETPLPAGFDPDASAADQRAAAAVLAYASAHQPFAARQVARLRPYRLSEAMGIDAATRQHLELFESTEDRTRRHTLVERIDRSQTALGARRLARWLGSPLVDPAAIAKRQDAVAWLTERDRVRARLRDALRGVRDLERLLAKAARPNSGPRDVVALRLSLEALPEVIAAVAGEEPVRLPDLEGPPPVLHLPTPVPEAAGLVAEALVDDPPVILRGSRGAGETGYVREGFRPELDELRGAARKGREWIAGLEARERERTGIATLKVRFHPVHGYSLEVTKAQLERVPGDYERKQTLANAERFTTPELRDAERSVLGANDRAASLEREIFEGVREQVLGHGAAIRAAADAVADLDALAALAEVAREDGWIRPTVDASLRLEIVGGRHPVVERVLAERSQEFVPNDAELDPDDGQLWVLTGPNMSGKSTYLRQVALLAILAQMGSFVPAERARIGVVDRVFTRVGASDRLARGESTFMVEMRETADILRRASRRSLVILDEIGRGTSTFDGLSIAWAVAEYLHDTPGLGARTLFATHYHELTDLARTKARVRNAHFQAREYGDEVVFLRRLAPGGANRSYGIQVGRLAGLPEPVVARAREILGNLEGGELDEAGRPRLAQHASEEPVPGEGQLGLFAAAPAVSAAERAALDALRACDPDRTTPLDALMLLRELVARLADGSDPA
jgi:DNA mismatch repair protein MutS